MIIEQQIGSTVVVELSILRLCFFHLHCCFLGFRLVWRICPIKLLMTFPDFEEVFFGRFPTSLLAKEGYKSKSRLVNNQSGAAEAWWAHNPQVPGSKPGSDKSGFQNPHIREPEFYIFNIIY
ncbi:hypothetical protein CICLE_v10003725mg, partial [Citrus x clementina]